MLPAVIGERDIKSQAALRLLPIRMRSTERAFNAHTGNGKAARTAAVGISLTSRYTVHTSQSAASLP